MKGIIHKLFGINKKAYQPELITEEHHTVCCTKCGWWEVVERETENLRSVCPECKRSTVLNRTRVRLKSNIFGGWILVGLDQVTESLQEIRHGN